MRLFDTGIFDSGIFKTGESAPGTFANPPFDTGIFDHASTTVGTFDTGIFDRNIFDNILGPITPGTYQYLGSPIQYVTGNKVRWAWEGEDEDEKKLKEVVRLGPVKQAQIETGIVSTRSKPHKPNTDRLSWLAADNIATESKRRRRIRQMIARDDEWLMSI